MAEAGVAAVETESTATTEQTSDVARRVAALRELAERDPESARNATWDWFKELGKKAGRAKDAADQLGELFREGTPPGRIDGQTEGILVSFVISTPVNVALGTITGGWMPWLGKRFNAEDARGDNVLTRSARWPAKLLWPLYGTKPAGGGNRAAFDFETELEPGKDDPDLTVLKIDYHDVTTNPRLLIRSIRDELVEIVPGAYLGKMLWRHDADRHTLLAYFALRAEG
jgi:hypothetical protein